jgi:hypothetical protein
MRHGGSDSVGSELMFFDQSLYQDAAHLSGSQHRNAALREISLHFLISVCDGVR